MERVGVVENNRLVEFYINNREEKAVGNIYRGRIINTLPGMEAAFVDIGEGKMLICILGMHCLRICYMKIKNQV